MDHDPAICDHAALMELVDHLPHAGDAARQVAVQVVLIAIVDADVWVDRPINPKRLNNILRSW